jgi:hypothetical protein
MERLVKQLHEHRDQRREEAERKYSEILLRFDHPGPGDAATLDGVMEELGIDVNELESDIQLLHQYRAYLGRKAEENPSIRGGKEDADNIRKMHPRLFLAMEHKSHHHSEHKSGSAHHHKSADGGDDQKNDHKSNAT